VPACRARPGDTRMPGVGAPPHVATPADIANRYHWVAILRAGRHDYSSSDRSSRATARSLDRRSGSMMAVTAQVVPREHRVPEFAEASRASRPVSPELLEDVKGKTPFEHLLDGPENSHDLPPVEARALLPTSDPLPPHGTLQLPGRLPPSAHAGEGAIGHGRTRGGQRQREECNKNCRSHVSALSIYGVRSTARKCSGSLRLCNSR
jgi:hypothetical protein